MFSSPGFKSAPLDFVIEMNRKPMMFVCIVAMVSMLNTFLQLFMSASDQTLCIAIHVPVFLIAMFASLGLRYLVCSPPVVEAGMFVVFLLFAAVHDYYIIFLAKDSGDSVARHRTLMFACVLWDLFPALMNLRIGHSVVFLIWHTSQLCICTAVHADMYDERLNINYYISPCVFGMCGFFLAFHSQGRLKLLYNVRHQVAAEKEAVDSLLSMVCEAAIWLSTDGDTVVRSDNRFDLLMGFPMKGATLSSCMPQDLSTREKDQLNAAFFQQSAGDHKTPVVLLPARLLRKPGIDLGVDLFIVDRRATLCASVTDLGLLVGIRVVSGGELAGLGMVAPDASMEAPSPSLAADASMESPPLSLVEDSEKEASVISSLALQAGAVPLPIDAMVLVCKTDGGTVPRSVLGICPGDFIVCVDRRTILPQRVKVVNVRFGSRLPKCTLGITSLAMGEADVTLPSACRVLIEAANRKASFPGELRHMANLCADKEHTLFVFDSQTLDVGCLPWRFQVAKPSTDAADPSANEVCVVDMGPGCANLAICVRVQTEADADAPFIGTTGPLLASNGLSKQSSGSGDSEFSTAGSSYCTMDAQSIGRSGKDVNAPPQLLGTTLTPSIAEVEVPCVQTL